MLLEHDLIPFQVSSLPPGPWLVFAPHPDDETFGMGGALLLARERHIPVSLVVLTDGRLGGGGDPSDLIRMREAEMQAVADRLGIDRLEFWRRPDRGLRLTVELTARIVSALQKLSPKTTFFPSPMEYHPDHRATAWAVWRATEQAGYEGNVWAYEISTEGRINRLIDITPVSEEKRALMGVYHSQLKENDYPGKVLALNRARTYSLPHEVCYAEGFYDFSGHRGRPFARVVEDILTPFWHEAEEESADGPAAPEAGEPAPKPEWDRATAPLVSIIVRTKDRPHLLAEALDSLVAQTYPNLEVIVVNDGGKDVTELIQGYRSRVPRLKYLDFQPGRGRSGAANAGLDAATGAYVGFLDDDDWLLPEHVATLVAVLKERPEKAVYSGVRCLRRQEGAWREVHVFNQSFDRLRLYCNNYLPIHGVLFERSLLKAGCRFDDQFEVYEDWDFWLQVSEHTDFYHCARVTACYRLQSGGGFGIRPDDHRQRSGIRQILAKWRERWSPETLQMILDQARRGLDQPLVEERIRQLEHALHEAHAAKALTESHVSNLEAAVRGHEGRERLLREELERTGAHVSNLEAAVRGHEAREQSLREELGLKERHITNLTQMVEILGREKAEMECEIAKRDRQIGYWRGAYEAILMSTSWRVTAPLRAVRRFGRFLPRLYRHRRFPIRLQPANDLKELEPGRYQATGPDPYFLLDFEHDEPAGGWIWIEGKLQASGVARPRLYFDTGEGFSERDLIPLSHLYREGRLSGPVRLPDTVRALRLDPGEQRGVYLCDGLRIREIGVFQAAVYFIRQRLNGLAENPMRPAEILSRIGSVYRHQGVLGLKLALTAPPRSGNENEYAAWMEHFGNLGEGDRAAIKAHIRSLGRHPRISVLMPVHNTPERWLRRALDSVLAQLYPNWELCIADDASDAPHVRRVLDEYRRRDSRIKVVYRQRNGHISAASNTALTRVSGEYVALLDHDDELAEHALYWVAVELNRHPEAELIYTDEDKIDADGNRYDPYFKPEWNPLLLCGQNYLSHLTVYRTERVREVGGFRQGLEGSQDWDLLLRVSERLEPRQIRHIPMVLYHWRAIPGSTALATGEKQYVIDASVRAVTEHFQRIGEAMSVEPWMGGFCRVHPLPPDPSPLVTLIIPTRNGGKLLPKCLESVLTRTDYPAFEILVVDNQSDDPDTLEYLAALDDHPNIRVLRYDAPFNFSAINNFAVREAQGEILGFVNDDIEVISEGWLREMVVYAVRPETGAVGAKLYYPDERIQHAGVILGLGGVAGHAWWGVPRPHPGQFGRNFLPQFLTAVTAACLVIRKQVFEQAGGFDEKGLAVAFNDVDLCLRVRQLGYANVWTPFAELYHHESATRGPEDTAAKQARFHNEIQIMYRRWGSLLKQDPAYNPNLSLVRYDFSIDEAPRLHKPWIEFAAEQHESAS